MGFFVYLQDRFECVRCRKVSDASIQTKLLRSEIDNSSHVYRVGASEVLDGLGNYCALQPWDRSSQLTVAVGDWDCDHCGLNRQWAKAVFDVRAMAQPLVATIVELSVLRPSRSEELASVHFVEPELAELSGLWKRLPQHDWHAGLADWHARSVAERSELIVTGYRLWCREVAGVNVAV